MCIRDRSLIGRGLIQKGCLEGFGSSVCGFEGIVLQMARWLSWLERRPVTAEVVGSNPIRVASLIHRYSCESMVFNGILAQLGEHLPYKQRVIGSSPIGPILASLPDAAVAEQADAQDLKSCGTNLPCRFDSGLRH